MSQDKLGFLELLNKSPNYLTCQEFHILGTVYNKPISLLNACHNSTAMLKLNVLLISIFKETTI